ncbi:IS5 family transposase [Neoroseomonas oryzicola]|uniref:IS5 family transposase n=1 Tax=Neoroseomonas oryzicola TaxID=535904 RepID=UPI0030BA1238
MVGPRHLGWHAGRARRGDAGRVAVDRQHYSQGASLGRGRKRGAELQAIGRSRGGRGTKIHLVVDGAGRILAFTVTPGQMGDLRPAHGLLANLPPPVFCAADTAYDSNGLRHFLLARGTTPVIPNNPTRKNPQPFDERTYRARNIIERTIGRLKDWRRIHTRYDKLAANFASAVAIAAILIGWT